MGLGLDKLDSVTYIAVAKSLSEYPPLPHIFVKCRVGKLLAKFTVGVSITRPALNNGMWFFVLYPNI